MALSVVAFVRDCKYSWKDKFDYDAEVLVVIAGCML